MIAVTGANGLVGSFITRKLVEEGLPVMAIVRKDSDLSLLDGLLDKIACRNADIMDVPSLFDVLQSCDTVIHAAAIISFSPGKSKKILDVNVGGTRNVVNTILALRNIRMIHVSSIAALGRAKGQEKIDEGTKWVDSALNSDYGHSKYLAELEVYRGIEEGLNAVIVNPSLVLAPGKWDQSTGQLFQYAWREKPYYTDGTLNYVDVRDLTEMIVRILRTGQAGEKFIANGGSIPMLAFFQEVGSRFNKKPPSLRLSNSFIGVVGWLEEMRSRLMGAEPLVTRQSARIATETFFYDAEKAKKLLQIQFRALDETLDWCCDHYLRNITPNK